MGLRLGWWTIDVAEAAAPARFYEALLGWQRLFDDPTGIAMVPELPPTLGQGFLLYLEHDREPKRGKNRAHVDLRPRDQDEAVRRALSLGATRVDVGQGAVSWEVLADPAGNEFCILAPRPTLDEELTVEAWVLDVRDVEASARFWRTLLDWEEVGREDDGIELGDPDGAAHRLLLAESPDAKHGKNRVHPDLFPDGPDEEAARRREVERALDLGASRADIGQGDVPWTVLRDPDGNEFCILRPPPSPEPA